MKTAVQEVQEVQELPELPRLIEAPAPVAEVPAPLEAVSKTRKTRRLVPAILSAALVGTLTFAVVQTVSLSRVNEELDASQSTVSDLRGDVEGLEGEVNDLTGSLTLAEDANDSLESTVAAQENQLADCAQANSLSLKADQAWHDAIGSIFGPGNFDASLAEYRTYARQWANAANACEPGAGYSFGNV